MIDPLTPAELARSTHERLRVEPECHVGYEDIRVSWELNLLEDPALRRKAIAIFAKQNGWVVEHRDQMARFRKRAAD